MNFKTSNEEISMPHRKPPKLPEAPIVAKDPVAVRLEKFLRDQGCAPQENGTWPVNWSDTLNFAKQETLRGKKKVGPFKDPAVNVLQEVRRLKHTCPGCGGEVDLHSGPNRLYPGTDSVKKGPFLWHQMCTSIKPDPLMMKDCVEEAEVDLKNLIKAILAVTVDTTSGYRLKLMASELRDKYAESMFDIDWSEGSEVQGLGRLRRNGG